MMWKCHTAAKNSTLWISLKKLKLTQEEENEGRRQKQPHVSALARLRNGNQSGYKQLHIVFTWWLKFLLYIQKSSRLQVKSLHCRSLAAPLTLSDVCWIHESSSEHRAKHATLLQFWKQKCLQSLALKDFAAPPIWREG